MAHIEPAREALRALVAGSVAKYSPNQPRDRRGRWSSGGLGVSVDQLNHLSPAARDAILRSQGQLVEKPRPETEPEPGFGEPSEKQKTAAARLDSQFVAAARHPTVTYRQGRIDMGGGRKADGVAYPGGLIVIGTSDDRFNADDYEYILKHEHTHAIDAAGRQAKMGTWRSQREYREDLDRLFWQIRDATHGRKGRGDARRQWKYSQSFWQDVMKARSETMAEIVSFYTTPTKRRALTEIESDWKDDLGKSPRAFAERVLRDHGLDHMIWEPIAKSTADPPFRFTDWEDGTPYLHEDEEEDPEEAREALRSMGLEKAEPDEEAPQEPTGRLWEATGTVHGSNGRWTPAMLEEWKRRQAGEDVEKFDPNQPRDERGRWTASGRSSSVDRDAAAAAAAGSFGGHATSLGSRDMPDKWPDDPDSRVDPVPIAADAAHAWRKLHPDRNGGLPETDYRNRSVDPAHTVRVADAYDAIDPKAPITPAAKKAWRRLANEVDEQYRFLTDRGVRFEFVEDDPYPDFRSLTEDLRQNGRVKVFTTRVQSKALGVDQYHPIFTDDENDRFRAVHDVFGHAAIGRGFDFNGEDAAYYHHGSMFSKGALRAAAIETRGQNSHYAKAQLQGKSPGESFDPYQRVGFIPDELLKRVMDMAFEDLQIELAKLAEESPELEWLLDSSFEIAKKAVKGPKLVGNVKRTKAEQAHEEAHTGSSAASGVYTHGKSIRWAHLYEKLKGKGYGKSKAAAISNSMYNKVRLYGKTGKPGAKSDAEASRRKKISASMKARHALRKNLSMGDLHVNQPVGVQQPLTNRRERWRKRLRRALAAK